MTLESALDHARRQVAAGQFGEAERWCREILVQHPQHGAALNLLGIIAYHSGHGPAAEQALRAAVAAEPECPRFHNDLGLLLAALGQPQAALAAHLEAARLQPDFAEAHGNAGNVLRYLDRLPEAAEAYRASLRASAAQPQVLSNLGVVLNALDDRAAAIECYRTAIRLRPTADIYFNYANALREAGQLAEAADAYGEAIRLRPTDHEACRNLCGVLSRLARHAEAVGAARRALSIKPDYAEGYCALATALQAQGDLEGAVAALEAALAVQPDLTLAKYNLGNALVSLGCMDEAMPLLRAGSELARLEPGAHSNLLYTGQFHPGFDAHAIRAEAELWNARHAEPFRRFRLPHPHSREPGRRLRIGYVSPFFRHHVLGRNLLPLVRGHDRAHFEIFCYSDTAVPDGLTREFEAATDVWRVTTELTDEALTTQIRDDRIDILVDLTLHMEGNRLLVLAREPAPVQVTFGGYPGTTGVEAIGYRLTDPHLDPPGRHDELYTEESIRLAKSFWCFDPLGDEVPVSTLPAAASGWVTFGCPCSTLKVNDRVLRLWARILAEVKNSRLVLLCPPGRGRARALAVFSQCGIAAERIEFFSPCPRDEHLRRQQRLDIVLDPFPYNGHTTTLEALWLGLPVITLVGESALARGSFSILTNLGLPELAAHSADEYVALATNLARDLPRLAELRASLRGRLQASPLMDAPRFARDIEAAFREMWRRWCAGNR